MALKRTKGSKPAKIRSVREPNAGFVVHSAEGAAASSSALNPVAAQKLAKSALARATASIADRRSSTS